MKERSQKTQLMSMADKKRIWHPFTQATEWEEEDIVIVDSAEGCWLVDTDENRYLDGISSLWVNVHGHRNKIIDNAVKAQLGKIAHSTLLGLASTPSIQLAEKLVRVAPGGLSKVFFSDSGSTAVEVALKMAFQFFQNRGGPGDVERTDFIAFTDAYHGDTVGSVSIGGMDLFHKVYKPLLFDAHRAPYPYCYRCPMGKSSEDCDHECLGALEKLLENHGDKCCALVIEPLVQGAAGIITAYDGFLKGVEELCRKHGVLLICDEVATGFGRTGKMFACEHEDVEPDFLCLAKGITGGYLPLAATITTDEVHEAFSAPYEENKTFFHGHSYTGNPLAAAAALASMALFEKDAMLEQIPTKAARLRSRLNQHLGGHPNIGEIRQRGMMVGIELVADVETKEPYPVKDRMGRQVIMEARKRGLIIRPLGDVVILMPPLSISTSEIDFLVETTAQAVEAVTGIKA